MFYQAFIPNTGRGIQGATSHCLGQNFAKMFDITFENEKGVREMVWQNSWAYTTRSVILRLLWLKMDNWCGDGNDASILYAAHYTFVHR
jgi:prolyl-tRNA synthetase